MHNSKNDTFVLAIDQGSQSTRAALFSTRGELLALEQIPVSHRKFKDGRIEQDGQELLESVLGAIDQVQEAGSDVAAAGMATQRSSVVAWNRHSGVPISPVISWQDTRGRDLIEQLDAATRSEIQRRSGLPVSAHYGATKLKWLTEQPDVARLIASGDCVVGPLAAFLLANLIDSSDEPQVDYANGGRMQLMNHATLEWDESLLKLFGISQNVLPVLRPNEFVYGELRGTSVPLVVMQGDQTAAVHASGELGPGIAHVNLGTGGFVLVAEPQGETERDERFLRSIAASNVDSSTFVIEGTVNGAGAALRWAEERLGASEGYSAANMDEWLGEEPEPIVFLNCVGGLGSPIWSPAGCFDWENVWVDFSGQEVANPSWVSAMCAVAESILFLININLGCMRRMGCRVGRIRVSGGLSRSDIFLQRLASLTGCEVERAVEVEATLCGVARMASHWLAESTGGWPEPQSGQTIQPAELADTAQLRQRYDVFCDLIERAN